MSEQFKAIMDLMQGAGVGTLWMFFGYLVFMLLKITLIFIGVIIAVRCLLRSLIKLCHSKHRHTVSELCRVCDVDCGYDGEVSGHQMHELIIKVKDKFER